MKAEQFQEFLHLAYRHVDLSFECANGANFDYFKSLEREFSAFITNKIKLLPSHRYFA